MSRTILRSLWILMAMATTGRCVAQELTPAEKTVLAGKAREVLAKNCAKCHGPGGTNSGGVSYILDAKLLIDKKKIVPGDPAKSRVIILTKVEELMPPEEEKVRPSAEELATLEKWIAAGAPIFEAPVAARKFRTTGDQLVAIRDDLRKQAKEDRPFRRYFSLLHLHNNPATTEIDLRVARAALSKVVNSLSFKNSIVVPEPIDADGTLLAIDLRRLDWDRCHLWNEILRSYPYGLKYDKIDDDAVRDLAAEIYDLSASDLPVVRADWFTANASRPPLYHHLLYTTLLKLPGESVGNGPRPKYVMTAHDLETKLNIDLADNFRKDKVARSGFTQSGVSAQNRLIERHETPYGAYWKSYDFITNDGTGNLFRHPLGPPAFAEKYPNQAFIHDGGEVIFHLPNGLQGYFLTNGKDERIDAGPVEVVSDRDRASGTVKIVNGVSCMACHKHGPISDFKDTVREGAALQGDARDKVRRVYPKHERMEVLLKEDSDRFVAALEKAVGPFLKIGADKAKDIRDFKEPVAEVAGKFVRGEVDVVAAAYELGLPGPDRLIAAIQSSDRLRELGLMPLAKKATIKREVWESGAGFNSPFQEIASLLELGTPKRVR